MNDAGNTCRTLGAAGGSQPERNWEPLLTPIEAAELLRLRPKTALRITCSHDVPAIRLGINWRFRCSDLTRWAESQIESGCQLSERLEKQ
jgi:excisionase family DNA binding protein